MIHIVSDSSCDLPDEYLAAHHIPIVPLTIIFPDAEYREKIDITPEEFYKKMTSSNTLPKTTQPSPAAFLKVFEETASPGDEILCITISSKLSGTFQSANVAKTMTSIPVTVFDSLAASSGHALQVMKAVDMRDKGCSMAEIVDALSEFRQHMTIFVYLQTLENIVKGGRITRFQGTVASIMNIKLICEGIEGEVVPLEKVRGNKRAVERLISLIGERGNGDLSNTTVCITHAQNLQDAELIKTEIINRYNCQNVLIYPVGPTVGAYTGIGGLVITF
ncbi:6-phosphogluconate dehydratase [Tepidanaerobacter syntrophicus]|uniref:EDD domain protein, DegV family n=1 Tax=Tepidanaerobacter syntrophicus TaxID=224999 RepID=A0A0U9HDS4_9FIRM|nr:DegV family protein [Tepidanaerobacter syntrophicus]GAQ24960.1 EDD domain protein, DegV family [Tepidanaerobacter syntrophicus]GLI19748.1 6-phosphogluconate dehydratase [Tepidanaerobacter syntrophicus]GLI51406.1 6-phosphogluconate dehydratase [Tepidanaerobacter syntrophicus]HHV82270.1 DegV family protein [Tepidanaerobacter syntrophicus]